MRFDVICNVSKVLAMAALLTSPFDVQDKIIKE